MPFTLSDRSIDMAFIRKVEEISGQNFKTCMQCGTCAAVCPMEESMNLTPRKIIHMAQLGQKEIVQSSNTHWICASCNSCEVRCPRGLDIPAIMEAFRQLMLRENNNFVEPFEIAKEKIEDMPQIAMVSSFRKHTS